MKILSVLILLFVLGCSVKEAYAPGNPPETKNKLFSAADFYGDFDSRGERQTIFLWPTERDGVPMTRDEKVESRANIVALSEELPGVTQQMEEKQVEVKKRIKVAVDALIDEFVSARCGLYCSEDAFDCEVDPEGTAIDDGDWKEPENDEEAQAIASCQKNMKDRVKVRDEIKEELKPYEKKVKEVTLSLLTEIGDENQRVLESIKIKVTDKDIEITLRGFEGLDYKLTNQSEELKAGNIVYDRKNGYLAFQVPAMKKNSEGELEVLGDYIFKLEIGDVGGVVPLNGDIQFFNNQTLELKTGRAALVLVKE